MILSRSTLRHTAYVLGENPLTIIAFSLFGLIIFVAIFGPALAPYDPLEPSGSRLQPPSPDHLFGTDHLGRDLLSRVIHATRLDLTIAIAAVFMGLIIGGLIGSLAGFYGGWVDTIISRGVDTIMAFPLFVLAMALVAVLGNSVQNVVYATAIINIPFYARVARAEINVLRQSGFAAAAKVSGNTDGQLLLRHLFPNILPSLMVQVSLNMGWAILNAAGLSFIGVGVQPPTPEWGILVASGADYIISGEWWLVLFPGLALMLAVLCFNLMGDGLRDLVDPRRRT